GHTDQRDSSEYFWKGVLEVFPEVIRQYSSHQQADLKSILYKSVRCGFYHAGMSQGRVAISSEYPIALGYEITRRVVLLNPHRLIPILKRHLAGYVTELEKADNCDLRERFERRFDYLMAWDPL
ncbi:MAG: hypothetical protein ACYC5O_20550, partial [Anaerolineae bacterium]